MESFHSCGVKFSKKCLYFKHSSFCSLCLAISDCKALSWDFKCLIFCKASCFFFVMSSAFFIALCAFWSLLCRKASKRSTSSSNICCDLFSASSFCLARSSSFKISAFLTSRLIWTKNISLFFATKSATFSVSLRASRPPMPSEAVLRRCSCASALGWMSSAASCVRRFLCTLEDAVVFSQTLKVLTLSRSSARRCLSCSLIWKI
mmetsp:Transcript_133814/g.334051  ORF Transcript_133814/g.334051 Transcript_133814/m.334051 type:complete len:205 (-) Transcript_133814:31-645(-)